MGEDASGALLAQRIHQAGHQLVERQLVPDDRYRIRAVVSGWIANPGVAVVISSGGTGLTGRDGTAEAVAPFWTKPSPALASCSGWCRLHPCGASSLQSRCLVPWMR